MTKHPGTERQRRNQGNATPRYDPPQKQHSSRQRATTPKCGIALQLSTTRQRGIAGDTSTTTQRVITVEHIITPQSNHPRDV
jgi:hypothetical protein